MTHRPALIPFPKSIDWGEGEADFIRRAPRARIVTPKDLEGEIEHAYAALARIIHEKAGYIAEAFPLLEEMDRESVADGGRAVEGSFALITAEIGDQAGREGYRLTIDQGASIEANDPAGLFYGVQTLGQLLTFEGGRLRAPRCRIVDWPQWEWRGVMLDQGRNYQSPEFLKRQIDIAAAYKLNTFHFHPTEYPGWRVEIKAFPELRSEKFYSQYELRDLVSYAAERFVTIVPEIEMPGHCTAFIDMMPHLKCTNDTMCMGNEELYSTMETILTEMAEIFPSPYIHIGTDECEGGEDCPRCAAKWQEVLSQPGHPPTLMAYFIARMNEIVKQLGRSTMTWNDQMENGIPKDVVIHSWKTGSDAPAIARQGYRTVNSHARDLYFDHGLTSEYVPRIYNWSPNEGQDLPIPNLLGGQGEAWHDPPVDDEWQIIEDLGFYPRLLTLAERVWASADGGDEFDIFNERLLEHKERFFKNLPFPYPEQTGNWHERYAGWTHPRGVWTPPEASQD